MQNDKDIENKTSSSAAAEPGVAEASAWHDALRALSTSELNEVGSGPVYDGHVTLELNADILSSIEATLDNLASTPDLFAFATHDAGGSEASHDTSHES